MMAMKWRKQYDGSEDLLSVATAKTFDHSEDLAIQSEAASADINTLVKRFGVNRLPPGSSMPFYGDFSDVSEYQDTLERVRVAHESFEALPANVRDRFRNNPAALLEFVHNPANLDEAVTLGLVPKKEPPPPPPPPPAPKETPEK